MTLSFPPFTPAVIWLLGINTAVFLGLWGLGTRSSILWVYNHIGLVPDSVVKHLAIWQIITYSFVHVDFWHWFGNMLLNDWNLLRKHFHAQVAARHHHSVGSFKDFFELLERLGLFQLCNHWNFSASVRNELLDLAHIRSGANEGDRNYVDAVLQAEFQICPVFLSESRDGQGHAWKIDPLVLSEQPAVNHFALYVFPLHASNT